MPVKFRKRVRTICVALCLAPWPLACTGTVPPSEGVGDESSPGGRGGKGPSAGAPGAVGGGSGSGDSLFGCDSATPVSTPQRIWRLSAAQYRNTVATLFEGRDAPLNKSVKALQAPFEDGASADRFSTYARTPVVGDLTLGRVMQSASAVAHEYVAHLKATNSGCAEDASFASCGMKLIDEAAEKLFRRPLADDEAAQYQKLLQDARAFLNGDEALALAFESMLMAPAFLYRSELGTGTADAEGRRKLSPYETAAAVSYSLTDAPPDEALWQAAAANQLSSPDEIRSQVERLVKQPAHRAVVMRFLKEYLRHDMAKDVFKEAKTYPFHDAAALVEDTDLLLAEIYDQHGREGFLKQLLTFDHVMARGRTATNYGLENELAAAAEPQLVRSPDPGRVGILGQPSFLTATSHSEATDPVRRGRFVAESLLCVEIPSLPIGVVPELPEPTPETTLRDRLKVHVEDPKCNACHQMMDPIGFGFEGFDHLGRVRTMEGGKPVDDEGVLVGAGAQDGPFRGVAELARKLSESELVSQCFVRHGFSFWLGRQAEEADGCALERVAKTFSESGQDHAAMLASLFSSDVFLLRRP